jgi:hypothetical protein
VIQEPLPAADQVPAMQPPGEAVTVTGCEPEAAPGLTEVGEIE